MMASSQQVVKQCSQKHLYFFNCEVFPLSTYVDHCAFINKCQRCLWTGVNVQDLDCVIS